MVGPHGVLRRALFSRGLGARLVAVRGLLYMTVQQLRTMEEGEGGGHSDEALEADPELSLSQVTFVIDDALLAAKSRGQAVFIVKTFVMLLNALGFICLGTNANWHLCSVHRLSFIK